MTSRTPVVLLCLSLLLAACAGEPRLAPEMPMLAGDPSDAVLFDAAGRPADPQEFRALVRAVSRDTEQRVMLDKLLETSKALADVSLVDGNRVRLLVDGPATFRAMFHDIDHARHHIHVETFILQDDAVGKNLVRHLVDAAGRGVDVRLMVDAVGSLDLPDAFLDELSKAGIEVRKFHPIDPTEDPRLWRSNNRDHRKLLVVDGRIGYTGGINFASVYSRSSMSVPRDAKETNEAWRDTHVRVEGPAVRQFQRAFVAQWNLDAPAAQRVDLAKVSPKVAPDGPMLVGAVTSDGGDRQASAIYSVLIAAVAHARQRVWITQAYFAPDQAFLEAIKAAAQRDVDVRLLLPGVSDAPLVVQASRATYGELLDAGVRIYERTGSTLHAKTMVVDSIWATVGSANFDYRSFVHNYEMNAIVVDGGFGKAMDKLFQVDLQQATEITPEQWHDRSVTQRAKEFFGNLLRRWL